MTLRITRIQFLSAVVIHFLVGLGTAYAQSSTATLSGIVIDESNAVVPGVKVTVLATSTGFQRENTTGGEGQFSFPALQPGRYSVRAELQGFTPVQVPELTLNVNDSVSIRLQLNVEKVGESVTVVAEPSRTNMSPAVSTVIDRRFVENLPLNGRSFQALLALTPGVVLTPSTAGTPGQFSVNGQRSAANQFLIDGVSANFGVNGTVSAGGIMGDQPALTSAGGTNGLVSVDALEEFKVQTSTYAPEFGRSPGGQVQIVTRSGTNRTTGSFFEYFRDEAMDANDWFANAANLPKAKLQQHDFGGVLGGPLRRDTLFYFVSYEGLRLQQPQTKLGHVPSLALRASASATVRPLLEAYPVPNGPDIVNPVSGQPTGAAQYTANFSDRLNLDATSVKVHYELRPGVSVFGRYNESPSTSATRALPTSTVLVASEDIRTVTVGANAVFGSRWFNELRVNYSRQRGVTANEIEALDGAAPPSESELFVDIYGSQVTTTAVQVFLPGADRMNLNRGPVADNLQRQVQIVGTTNLVAGNHTVKVGADYRLLRPRRALPERDSLLLLNSTAAIQNGVATTILTRRNGPAEPTLSNLSLFVQDTWAATSRLNVTYGLRWDLNPPPTSPEGQEPLVVRGLTGSPSEYSVAPRGTPLYGTSYRSIAPRVGIAYRVRDDGRRSTTIRGGVGLFYDLGNNDAIRSYSNFPFQTTLQLNQVALPPRPADVTPPPLPTTIAPPYGQVAGFAEDFKVPRTWQWNVTVEQELSSVSHLTASYVGARGVNLIRSELRSRPNPNFSGNVQAIRSDASSDYRALQTQYTRRLNRSIQAHAAYTWSRAIDDASDSFNLAILRGPADFDVRHVVSAALTYSAPKFGSNVLNAIAGDWSISGLGRWQSAYPVKITSALIIGVDGVFREIRPNLLSDVPIYVEDRSAPGGRSLNRSLDPSRPGCVGPFCAPASGVQGDLGRNRIRGFPAAQIDLSLRRSFPFLVRTKISLAVDVFNVLNHPNFGLPVGDISNARFGRATTMLGRGLGGVSPVYQIGGPRSVQLSARIGF